jgi:hypothetical protein
MFRHRALRLAVFACASLLPAAAAPDLLDFAVPQARFAFGVHVRKLANSPVVQTMSDDVKRSAGADWQKVFAAAGFDPFRDVEEVLITSTGGAKNAPALIVVRGSFDVKRLAANAERYEGVPILVTGQKGAGAVAFLDETTVIAGEMPLVRQAVARRAAPAAVDSTLAAKIAAMRTRYDLWGVSIAPLGELANDLPAGAAGNSLNSIDQFQFGLTLSRGMELSAELRARTAAEAKKLSDSLRMFEAMMKANPRVDAPSVDMSVADRTIRISLSVPEAQLIQAMRQGITAGRNAVAARAAASGAPGFPMATAAPAVPQRPPEPNRLAGYSDNTVLVITGSQTDGGTQVTTDDGKTQSLTLP